MPNYLDFVPRQRFEATFALSPDGSTVAYSSNVSGQFDLWVTSTSGGQPRQLTHLQGHAVRQIAWAPDGMSLIFSADRHGDEQYRIYRISLDDHDLTEISSGPDCQRVLGTTPFDASGRYLAYAANDRDITVQDLLVRDLNLGTERRFTPPTGVVFEPASISPDGRWLLAGGFRSNSEIASYLIDLKAADSAPVEVTEEFGIGLFRPGPWAPDSSGFYLLTDLWGDFTAAAFYSLSDSALSIVAQHGWDVEGIEVAGDTLIWSVNEGGRSALYSRRSGTESPLPLIPDGVIHHLDVSPNSERLAMLIEGATRPTEIAVIEFSGGFRYLTDSRPSALHVVNPVEPETIDYPGSDGRRLFGLLYRPRATGPHPVVLSIHGGPEAQERPSYMRSGLYQHLVDRGIAVFAPNIAGSTGFGKLHQKRIYRDWGGADLDDLDRSVQYLQTRPELAHDCIAVMGGSYGGFAALSCLARLPYAFAAGVSMCGPSNLVTLASAAPPTWKAFVSRVLGDPETDAERLAERSPITYAESISAPLFVIQGARDPRVPRRESDQLVQRLQSRGVDVKYTVFDDEGHGFSSRQNELHAYEEIANFLTANLSLQPTRSAS